jgi:excisionase family DNA binding protein
MTTQTEIDALLSPTQAAQRAGISAQRLRQLADEGKVPAVRTALGRLFARADIDRLIKERAAGAA